MLSGGDCGRSPSEFKSRGTDDSLYFPQSLQAKSGEPISSTARRSRASTGCDGRSEAFWGSGVKVQMVRPSFLFTKMTNVRVPTPIVAPDAVAAGVLRGRSATHR